MIRKMVTVWVSLLMVFCFVVILDITTDYIPTAKGTTLYVNTSGSGGAYTSIQVAIDAANSGDTVYVYNGTYTEDIMVNKTINLSGEDKDTTIIDGDGFQNTVHVTSHWVNITGFTVTGEGWFLDNAGIKLNNVQNCSLSNNNVSSNENYGIHVYSSNNNNITNNELSKNKIGIFLENSKGNIVSGNNASDNSNKAISLIYSNLNTILDNKVSKSWYGIYIDSSSWNEVKNNTMFENGIFIRGTSLEHWNTHEIDTLNTANGKPIYYLKNQIGGIIPSDAGQVILANSTDINVKNQELHSASVGILMGFSSNNSIFGNNVSGNQYGIYFFSSNETTIFNNNISDNDVGIQFYSSYNNNLSNNIIENSETGIDMYENCNNTTISNNNISNNRGISIYTHYCENITITGNTFKYNRDAMYLDTPNYFTINNNNISLNTGRGVQVQSGRENKLSDNDFYNNSCAINVYFSNENTIVANTMVGNGIYIDGSLIEQWNSHVIDISNTVNGKPLYYWKDQIGGTVPAGAGEIILANCQNVTIENQELTNGTVGIELGFSSNNSVKSNDASMNNYNSIYIAYSNDNCVFDNIASYSNNGIYIKGSDRNNIVSNIVVSNNDRGIQVSQSNDNDLINNIVSYNDYSIFTATSTGNNITGNLVSYNLYGILVNVCSNIIINHNRIISNSQYGIRVVDSDFNLIYHNNVVNNNAQAYDNRDTSQWNETYGIGGNFWSDYSGFDDFSGPNQDIPGSDGIGDTPYVFDLGSQDNYPLMTYLGNFTFLYDGWNLISIPFIQSDTNLSTVLSPIEGSYDAVQWYNTTDYNDHWKHNHTQKPSHLNDLNHIHNTMSFWIHITKPCGDMFEYPGLPPTSNQTIQLYQGWNMVGYPSQTNHNRTVGLNNLTFRDQVDAIWTYDATTQKWERMGESDHFMIGKGYYIHATTLCEWEVPL